MLKTKGESGRKFGYPNSTTFPTAASCRSDLIFLNPVHSFFVCVNQNAKVFKGLETREKTGHASYPFPFHVVEKQEIYSTLTLQKSFVKTVYNVIWSLLVNALISPR